ncbi:MAG: cupin domain-containing protein [Ruegeria sp.]
MAEKISSFRTLNTLDEFSRYTSAYDEIEGKRLMKKCVKLRPGAAYSGKQGFDYFEGIAQETTGSTGICMHLLTVPPGGRAKAHKHEDHETAIYVISGSAKMYWGERLEHIMETSAGDLIYIPAGTPHLPFNDGTRTAVAVVARTDPKEQESVVLMPELEAQISE